MSFSLYRCDAELQKSSILLASASLQRNSKPLQTTVNMVPVQITMVYIFVSSLAAIACSAENITFVAYSDTACNSIVFIAQQFPNVCMPLNNVTSAGGASLNVSILNDSAVEVGTFLGSSLCENMRLFADNIVPSSHREE